ncbi:MAG: MOSC domain-containing protein [Verrucomicrobia bacterium]|nr:MOSC domain-containing protein [Verrucomicrobiota bacterium]
MAVSDMVGRVGRVASLHLHPTQAGAAMQPAAVFEVAAGRGIVNEPRYFDRRNPQTGEPSRRQISLLEREQIAEHAVALNRPALPPGAVRANIETTGLCLVPLIGRRLQVGEAILQVYAARQPCAKMDTVSPGLRRRMESDRQGVLAQIIQSGVIRVGDAIRVMGEPGLALPTDASP